MPAEFVDIGPWHLWLVIRAVTMKRCEASDTWDGAAARIGRALTASGPLCERVRACARALVRSDAGAIAWPYARVARTFARAAMDPCRGAERVTATITVTDAQLRGLIAGNTQWAWRWVITHEAVLDLSVRPLMPRGIATERWTDRATRVPRFAIVAV